MNAAFRWSAILAAVLLAGCVVFPASAFTADTLLIDVQENGDSEVSFSYSLSWIEHIAVFLKIADPADELKRALEGHSNKTVDVTDVTSGSASFLVYEFTRVEEGEGLLRYRTPELSFAEAEKVLQEYWFAPLISTDLSPSEIRITFPDGYTEEFADLVVVPPVTHEIPL